MSSSSMPCAWGRRGHGGGRACSSLGFQWLRHRLAELGEQLDGELGAEGATGDHLVKRPGEAHANGGPAVQLEGGHHPFTHAM